jgi:hypothetical protein
MLYSVVNALINYKTDIDRTLYILTGFTILLELQLHHIRANRKNIVTIILSKFKR